MKSIRLLLIAVLVAATGSLQAQTFKADLEKSKLKWTGEKVTGKHWGHIKLKSGELGIKNGKITKGTFIIDMNSITCEDLEDAGYNQKLVGHLKSDDFFGVEKYPEAKLVLKKGAAFKNGEAKFKADLTIKKNTESVFFVVKEKDGKYFATITVDRSKYDVRYGSNSFFDNLGDKAISDNFTLEVELVLSEEQS